MTITIQHDEFSAWKVYIRGIFNDISGAKIGPYHNNPKLEEIAVAWNPDEEGPAIKGYPMPENITHHKRAPSGFKSDEINSYHLRQVMVDAFTAAGFREMKSGGFISEARKNQFDYKAHTGYERSGAEVAYIMFVRAKGDLSKGLDFVKKISDEGLDELCRKALKKKGITVSP